MTGRPRPEIRLDFEGGERQGRSYAYSVAGRRVLSNQPVEELDSISDVESCSFRCPESPTYVGLQPVYEGVGWVAGRQVAIECAAAEGLYRVSVGKTLEMRLEVSEGCTIRIEAPSSDRSARMTALGPGLALALAETGIASLHAAAIRLGSRVLLLAGESGVGKSTLAAEAALSGQGERLADDVVPVALSRQRLLALPRFPQLKLSASQQWQGEAELPVAELLAVRRDPGVTRPERRRLSGRRAVLCLLENTVASRLFAPSLSRRHLDFSIRAAEAVSVTELVVPEGLDRLDRTLELLRSGRLA